MRSPTALAIVVLAGVLGVPTRAPAAPAIYSCVNAKGQRVTSDRPIPAYRNAKITLNINRNS